MKKINLTDKTLWVSLFIFLAVAVIFIEIMIPNDNQNTTATVAGVTTPSPSPTYKPFTGLSCSTVGSTSSYTETNGPGSTRTSTYQCMKCNDIFAIDNPNSHTIWMPIKYNTTQYGSLCEQKSTVSNVVETIGYKTDKFGQCINTSDNTFSTSWTEEPTATTSCPIIPPPPSPQPTTRPIPLKCLVLKSTLDQRKLFQNEFNTVYKTAGKMVQQTVYDYLECPSPYRTYGKSECAVWGDTSMFGFSCPSK